MRFYALHEGIYEGVQKRIELLRAVCEEKSIEFICLDSAACDYTSLPSLGKGDLLYNFARGSSFLEALLMNEEVTTYYIRNPMLPYLNYDTTGYTVIHFKHGIPEPKTIFHLTNDRTLLPRYVEYLGGFPIIVKAIGTTRGIGTLKLESWHSLYATVDYLMTTGDKFIMREFIKADHGARIMVLGNEVILSTKFFFQENDFRNAPVLSATRYEPMQVSKEIEDICIKAVRLANLEMAGVDLLFDTQGNPYLLEINFPTGFQSFKDNPQPVLSRMIDYLINKSKRNGQ